MRSSFVRRGISRSVVGLVIPVLAAAACSGDGSSPVAACTAAYTPSVRAHVTDSVSGAPLAETSLGVIRDNTIVDSLRYFAPPDEMVAGGSPGTYAVTVAHPGYADWTRTNVIVTPTGFCGTVNTVTLQVKLVPLP